MSVKLNLCLTEQQHEAIKVFADAHGVTVLQMIRDVMCDIAGLDAALTRPPKTNLKNDPVRMPPIPDQSAHEIAADYARRGFSKAYIASRTKMPWRDIEAIMKANPYVKSTKV
jgi:hypothetical protein